MSSKVILKAEDLDGYLTEKDQEYLSKLDKLYDEAYAESDEIKNLVKELVPTYKIYEEQ